MNQNGRAYIWPGFQLLEQDGHMDMYFCEILHLHKLGKKLVHFMHFVQRNKSSVDNTQGLTWCCCKLCVLSTNDFFYLVQHLFLFCIVFSFRGKEMTVKIEVLRDQKQQNKLLSKWVCWTYYC